MKAIPRNVLELATCGQESNTLKQLGFYNILKAIGTAERNGAGSRDYL